MADKTGIEWTDASWNPVTGCSKVSQGCKFCYAKHQAWPRLSATKNTVYTWRLFEDVACHHERLGQPLRWAKPRKIFVNSMSDLFHEDVPDAFLDKVFAIMGLCYVMDRGHVFQVLTKRHERMCKYLSDPTTIYRTTRAMKEIGPELPGENSPPTWPLPNVWLGVSVEDQEAADARIPVLLQTPAAVRWISAEPLLGPIDLPGLFYYGIERTGGVVPLRERGHAQLDWVVVGGESGPNARPMHPDWVRSLRDQCADAGVPFLFKQWGEWSPEDAGETSHSDTVGILPSGDCAFYSEGYVAPFDKHERFVATDGVRLDGRTLMDRVGKKRAGRLLDGVEHDNYPACDRRSI